MRGPAGLATQLRYVSALDGTVATTLGEVDVERVACGLPVRRVRSYAGDQHYSGWSPTVWALRVALTDPDTDPGEVRHPELAAALQHNTGSPGGAVQCWRLLRDAQGARSAASAGGGGSQR